MNSPRFDALTRRVSAPVNRRIGLGVLVGASLPVLGLSAVADAKKKKKKATLCLNGQTVKKPKKKVKKFLKQGATKGACDPTLCGNGGPCTVFVTAAGFKASQIGSLAGGDARCQAAADAANLNGAYKAWLSFGSATPGSRFANVTRAGPYRLTPNGSDGTNPPPLVVTDFATLIACSGSNCLQSPINRTETGGVVAGDPRAWTGTFPNGTSTPFTCSGWTNDAELGVIGRSDLADSSWTNHGTSLGGQALRLYCFQQVE